MSCPLRLGSGVRRGVGYRPPAGLLPLALFGLGHDSHPLIYKSSKKETRLLPGAGLRVVRFHRVTCEAQVAPRPGVLLPPLGQLIPATLPVAGLPSKTCCH